MSREPTYYPAFAQCNFYTTGMTPRHKVAFYDARGSLLAAMRAADRIAPVASSGSLTPINEWVAHVRASLGAAADADPEYRAVLGDIQRFSAGGSTSLRCSYYSGSRGATTGSSSGRRCEEDEEEEAAAGEECFPSAAVDALCCE